MKGPRKQLKRPFHFFILYGQAIYSERTHKITNLLEQFDTKVITKWL